MHNGRKMPDSVWSTPRRRPAPIAPMAPPPRRSHSGRAVATIVALVYLAVVGAVVVMLWR